MRKCGVAALLISGAFAGLVTPPSCFAQVHLPTVNLGDTNFEDAFGAPGWFLEEFVDGYVAGDFRDFRGNVVPGTNHLTAYSATTHVAFMWKKRVLGGYLMAEALQPLADITQLTDGAESRVRGFADLTVGPGLQWAPKKIGGGVFVQRALLDVDVPTGKYSDTRPLNVGNHFVVVNPYYSATYERGKVEFSTRLHYLWNSTNNDPFVGLGLKTTQAGQAFHMNYATSFELLKNLRLGFNGYWLQQLTFDKADGIAIPDSKERTVGLGPGIQLGGENLWFRVNSYIETDVRDRPSGIKVTFRISKAVPSK